MILQFQPLIKKKYSKEVCDQINSGWIGTGDTTEKFEDMVKNLFDCNHGISTTSGTIAFIASTINRNPARMDGYTSKRRSIYLP